MPRRPDYATFPGEEEDNPETNHSLPPSYDDIANSPVSASSVNREQRYIRQYYSDTPLCDCHICPYHLTFWGCVFVLLCILAVIELMMIFRLCIWLQGWPASRSL
ncbi:hypothetical protein BJX66DRAFT_337388 [Aspergillus keveii]|uniref:Uncharacterized protein n=1 Tax=Aspergillus keveii TaxID=714993 RepID=A0ABR4G8N8_9EURO